MSSFERLLARVLRQPVPAITPCPTAETLAAYLENGLTRAEHAQVEGHASRCARCSAHLAALVHLADRLDDRPASAPAWWRRHPWLVPAAALALTVVVWTSLPRERVAEFARPAPTSIAPPVPAGAPETNDSSAPPVRTPKTRALDVAQKMPAPAPSGAPQNTDASASKPKPLRQQEALADKDARFELQSKTAPRGAAAAAGPNQPVSESERDKVDRLARADAAPPAANEVVIPSRELAETAPEARQQATAAAPSAPAELKKEQAKDANASRRAGQLAAAPAPPAPPAPVTSSADAGVSALSSGARLEGRLKAATRPLVIAAPDGRTSWRVRAGRIERSTDGGGTWTIERGPALSSPVAGAAPAADTCWLVDARGLILRRDPAGRWQAVASPPADAAVVGIEARSAAEATLSTAGGQRYATTDGGLTWQAVAR
jgi:hypothetical protein